MFNEHNDDNNSEDEMNQNMKDYMTVIKTELQQSFNKNVENISSRIANNH